MTDNTPGETASGIVMPAHVCQRGNLSTLINVFPPNRDDDFSMFNSMLDHKDLIFQDSAVRLVALDEKEQDYKEYLGSR